MNPINRGRVRLVSSSLASHLPAVLGIASLALTGCLPQKPAVSKKSSDSQSSYTGYYTAPIVANPVGGAAPGAPAPAPVIPSIPVAPVTPPVTPPPTNSNGSGDLLIPGGSTDTSNLQLQVKWFSATAGTSNFPTTPTVMPEGATVAVATARDAAYLWFDVVDGQGRSSAYQPSGYTWSAMPAQVVSITPSPTVPNQALVAIGADRVEGMGEITVVGSVLGRVLTKKIKVENQLAIRDLDGTKRIKVFTKEEVGLPRPEREITLQINNTFGLERVTNGYWRDFRPVAVDSTTGVALNPQPQFVWEDNKADASVIQIQTVAGQPSVRRVSGTTKLGYTVLPVYAILADGKRTHYVNIQFENYDPKTTVLQYNSNRCRLAAAGNDVKCIAFINPPYVDADAFTDHCEPNFPVNRNIPYWVRIGTGSITRRDDTGPIYVAHTAADNLLIKTQQDPTGRTVPAVIAPEEVIQIEMKSGAADNVMLEAWAGARDGSTTVESLDRWFISQKYVIERIVLSKNSTCTPITRAQMSSQTQANVKARFEILNTSDQPQTTLRVSRSALNGVMLKARLVEGDNHVATAPHKIRVQQGDGSQPPQVNALLAIAGSSQYTNIIDIRNNGEFWLRVNPNATVGTRFKIIVLSEQFPFYAKTDMQLPVLRNDFDVEIIP